MSINNKHEERFTTLDHLDSPLLGLLGAHPVQSSLQRDNNIILLLLPDELLMMILFIDLSLVSKELLLISFPLKRFTIAQL